MLDPKKYTDELGQVKARLKLILRVNLAYIFLQYQFNLILE